ncbi:MAG: ribosomal L7Ae/L30e/S12e/Gadd45 family protein [Clostridia bacterium]|nr:ribosomal L7Ae/L30e/S12e/Gadd45 family protein [Clostridia bacterium]
MNDSTLSLLGLCRKAGKISFGFEACRPSIRSGKARLCLVSSDASERVCDKILVAAKENGVKTVLLKYTMYDLKDATGVKAAVATVDDEGFAKSVMKKINENMSGEECVL